MHPKWSVPSSITDKTTLLEYLGVGTGLETTSVVFRTLHGGICQGSILGTMTFSLRTYSLVLESALL